ncbi:MAG: hypothetical protein E6G60_02340 [Actinobacteria bacterium]|nr:MAG: hypothetical protein E6G60_02340 [Actinomycetota bacterium]
MGRGSVVDVFRQDLDVAASILAGRGIPALWVPMPGPVGTALANNPLMPLYQAVATKYGQRFLDGGVPVVINGVYVQYVPCVSPPTPVTASSESLRCATPTSRTLRRAALAATPNTLPTEPEPHRTEVIVTRGLLPLGES